MNKMAINAYQRISPLRGGGFESSLSSVVVIVCCCVVEASN